MQQRFFFLLQIVFLTFFSATLCGVSLPVAAHNPAIAKKKQIEVRKKEQRLERAKEVQKSEAKKNAEKRKIIEAKKQWAQPLSKGKYKPPPYAIAMLSEIRRNRAPLPNHAGGGVFHNEPNKSGQIALPREAAGVYRKFDIHPKANEKNRGVERIVINQRTGAAYYTNSHYRNFVLMD